jgi:hypothetical protein
MLMLLMSKMMVMMVMIITAGGEGFESISIGYIDSLSLDLMPQHIAHQLLCLPQLIFHSIKIVNFARTSGVRFVL